MMMDWSLVLGVLMGKGSKVAGAVSRGENLDPTSGD